jgi:hypothetical protein
LSETASFSVPEPFGSRIFLLIGCIAAACQLRRHQHPRVDHLRDAG